MHWHNGKIEINGKKIKPEDEKKYNEIHDKYFEGCKVFRKQENLNNRNSVLSTAD